VVPIEVEGRDVHSPDTDPVRLRREVGMAVSEVQSVSAQHLRERRLRSPAGRRKNKEILDQRVEESLRGAALWDEVKDRLNDNAFGLSGGQQQRLCIARAIAVKPSVLLMDEPCSALDPVATFKIEDLITQLKENFTVVIVTHSMQQATRVSEWTAFFYLGKVVEFGLTTDIFGSSEGEAHHRLRHRTLQLSFTCRSPVHISRCRGRLSSAMNANCDGIETKLGLMNCLDLLDRGIRVLYAPPSDMKLTFVTDTYAPSSTALPGHWNGSSRVARTPTPG